MRKLVGGLINAKDAANVITNNGTTSLLQELNIQNGETFTVNVTSDGTEPLLASISWFDVGTGIPTASSTNSPIVLVNDLDIRITKDTTTYFPWRLTGVTTNANDGDNDRDAFERIDINNPTAGTYTIIVTHKGSLDASGEVYTLIVSGITSNS